MQEEKEAGQSAIRRAQASRGQSPWLCPYLASANVFLELLARNNSFKTKFYFSPLTLVFLGKICEKLCYSWRNSFAIVYKLKNFNSQIGAIKTKSNLEMD